MTTTTTESAISRHLANLQAQQAWRKQRKADHCRLGLGSSVLVRSSVGTTHVKATSVVTFLWNLSATFPERAIVNSKLQPHPLILANHFASFLRQPTFLIHRTSAGTSEHPQSLTHPQIVWHDHAPRPQPAFRASIQQGPQRARFHNCGVRLTSYYL